MAKLEYDTNRTTIEFVIEIKILMLEQNIKAESFAEENFQDLFSQQQLLEQRYVSALESIGLSPAGEDDMDEVKEMEHVAARKNAQSADDTPAARDASMEFVARSLEYETSSGHGIGGQGNGDEENEETRVTFAAVFGTVASFFVLGIFGEKTRASVVAGDFSEAI